MGRFNYEYVTYGFTVNSWRDAQERSLYLDVGNSFARGVIDHHHVHAYYPQYKELTSTAGMLRQLIMSSERDSLWPGAGDTWDLICKFKKDRNPVTFVVHRNPDLDTLFSAYILEKYLEEEDFNFISYRLVEHNFGQVLELIDQADRGIYEHEDFRNPGNPYSVLEIIEQMIHGSGTIREKAMVMENWELVRMRFYRFLDEFLAQPRIEDLSTFGQEWVGRNHPRAIQLHAETDKERKNYTARPEDRYEECVAVRADLPIFAMKEGRFSMERKNVLWILMNEATSPIFNQLKEKYRKTDDRIWIVYYPPRMNVKISRHRLVISVDGGAGWALFGYGWHLERLEREFRRELNGTGLSPDYGPISLSNPRKGYDSSDPWYDGRGHDFTICDSPNLGTVLGELISENEDGREHVLGVLSHLENTCKDDLESWTASPYFVEGSDLFASRESRLHLVIYLLDQAHPRWPSSFADAIRDLLRRNLKEPPSDPGGFREPALMAKAILGYLDPDAGQHPSGLPNEQIKNIRTALRESMESFARQNDSLRIALSEAGCGIRK